MAVTQAERIFDLAYGAGYSPQEIAAIAKVSESEVITTLGNLGNGPSPAASFATATEASCTATLFGNIRQTGNANRPARSNADYLGLSGAKDSALQATGIGNAVAVPVKAGDIFKRVGLMVGETAGGTITHQFAALYEGTGAEPGLLKQSKDTTNAAIAANTIVFWELEGTVEATVTNAPNGYLYALVAITASTIPTAYAGATEAKINVQEKPEGPLFLSAKVGSALGGTAKSKLESAAAVTTAPIVFLA